MDSFQAMELAKAGLLLTLTIVGPMLIASLIVGVAIGLFQALTQIQEMTLTFVPKILVMGLVLLLSLPMIGGALSAFMARIADVIVHG
ncbi:flagellar biosynthetic protein FliQ [Sphingomonas laterariae]|uniref:Flagellar biosynthetic protein FliQ n=1 Tax=Edaphosphingomonas laterariae TaxID=861865 RepID=A0A239KLM0_9SPHN|nr:flagellar biosynthetic protein FliQ [Sphingomonas laterariae]SNT18503.1 flagellar biosynthetic protein FliQ [Sphingomonas laterariae]